MLRHWSGAARSYEVANLLLRLRPDAPSCAKALNQSAIVGREDAEPVLTDAFGGEEPVDF